MVMETSSVLIISIVSLVAITGLVLFSQGTATGLAFCPPGYELRINYQSEYATFKECMPKIQNVYIVPQQSTAITGDPYSTMFETQQLKKQRKEDTLVGARTRPW